jgi:hypothetical protein
MKGEKILEDTKIDIKEIIAHTTNFKIDIVKTPLKAIIPISINREPMEENNKGKLRGDLRIK